MDKINVSTSPVIRHYKMVYVPIQFPPSGVVRIHQRYYLPQYDEFEGQLTGIRAYGVLIPGDPPTPFDLSGVGIIGVNNFLLEDLQYWELILVNKYNNKECVIDRQPLGELLVQAADLDANVIQRFFLPEIDIPASYLININPNPITVDPASNYYICLGFMYQYPNEVSKRKPRKRILIKR